MILLLCATFVGCSKDESARRSQLGQVRAVGDDVVPIPKADPGDRREWGRTLRTGMIYYQWSEWLEVRRDIVLEEVRPRAVDPGFEFIEARINFAPYPVYPVGGCLDHWPPTFSPGLFVPRLFNLPAGTRLVVTFFFRTTREGEFSSNGLVFDYRRAGRPYRFVSRVTTLTAHVRDQPTGSLCDPRQSVDDQWVR